MTLFLNWIIQASLRHRLLVLGLAVAVMGFGVQSLFRTRVDVFPDLNRPVVTILTEGHGLAPEEVEALVSLPIEAALNGVPGLVRLRSQSGIGLSVVWAEFDWGQDIWRIRQLVAERLSLARDRLPADVVPFLGPISSIMGEVVWIGLTSKDDAQGKPVVSPLDLRTFGDWVLRPRLLSIPGVSQVIVMGGGLKQAQIQLIPDEINRRQLDWTELRNRLVSVGDNTAGGFLDKEGQELLVRNMGRPVDLEDIKNTVVGTWLGRPVQVRDIAKVAWGPATARGAAGINARPGVILTVQKSPEADTIALTRKVDQALREMTTQVPPGVEMHPDLFRQSTFIESAIYNVNKALIEGVVLVCIILILFLGSWRVTTVTLTAIPLSFLATAVVLHVFGLSVNTMTLGGLAVATGELVDDAIVDIENIFRRLRQARSRGVTGLDELLAVIFHASVEVRSSIVIATAIVILAFLPLLAMGGMEGRLFLPLGIAYMVSILCSLLVSITVTPVLSSYLLMRAPETGHAKDTWLLARLKRFQEENLRHMLNHPRPVLATCGVLVTLAFIGFALKGKEFLPPFNEMTSTVIFSMPPGISLAESDAAGRKAEQILLGIPEVASVNRRTGRAEGDEHAEGVQKAEIEVNYGPKGRSRIQVIAEITRKMEEAFPTASISIGAQLAHRIDHMLSGVEAAVAIKVFGDDLATLRALARNIAEVLDGTPGLVDLAPEQQVLVPELKVELDRDRLKTARLSAGEVADALEMAFNGERVGTLIEGQRRVDIVARLAPEWRSSPEAMEAARLATLPDGSWVHVSDVADIFETVGANQVLREGMQRRIVVKANVRGRSLSGAVREVQRKLATVSVPTGYRIVLGGQYESQQEGQRRILLLGGFALVAVFVMLFTHYRSWLIALQVMVNVPLALVGSVAALYLTFGNISLASIVAFITLCGVASRNGILMISHYIHLMAEEGERFTDHMIIRGSLERLGPVLMTASTAMLALVPFLVEPHKPGREILYPVAVVIVGGLISSTLLDIFVTPVLFKLTGPSLLKAGVIKFNQHGAPRRARRTR